MITFINELFFLCSMVAPRHRSRTKRRVFVRTPKGGSTLTFRMRKPSPARCPVTGEILKGVPREIPSKLKNMPKSHKRPERPFGGVLSGRAMRRLFISEARAVQEQEE